MRISTFTIAILVAVLAGCGAASTALDSAIDRAATRTGEGVGDAVGQRVGEMASTLVLAQFPENWSARWTSLYVNYLLHVGLASGSYAVVEEAYEPGEWTRWNMLEGSEPTGAVVERAFLGTESEGEEWWRVRYVNTNDDEAIVLEALFADDRQELVRMRAQFPGEEPQELPVERGTYGYAEPIQLTEESLEGATVGSERVDVPAGAFEARHVRYGSAGATLEWWIQDEVPGHLVKYLRRVDETGSDEAGDSISQSWTVELESYGDDAVRELSG